jgi:hypothetical protein
MALDRFIDFEKKGPTKKQVESVTRNFFGEGTTELIEWRGKSLVVKLAGKPSFPFADLEPDMLGALQGKERWIEICMVGRLDVITRMQDEYTNVQAAGLAELFARYWDGEVEDAS